MMLLRLYRMLPLIIILAVLAAVIYLVSLYRYSPPKAKDILIRVFLRLTVVLSAAFAVATVYAWFDSNIFVFELIAGCLGIMLITLGIVLLCRWRFLKNNPEYRRKADKTTGTERFPWLHGKK